MDEFQSLSHTWEQNELHNATWPMICSMGAWGSMYYSFAHIKHTLHSVQTGDSPAVNLLCYTKETVPITTCTPRLAYRVLQVRAWKQSRHQRYHNACNSDL